MKLDNVTLLCIDGGEVMTQAVLNLYKALCVSADKVEFNSVKYIRKNLATIRACVCIIPFCSQANGARPWRGSFPVRPPKMAAPFSGLLLSRTPFGGRSDTAV